MESITDIDRTAESTDKNTITKEDFKKYLNVFFGSYITKEDLKIILTNGELGLKENDMAYLCKYGPFDKDGGVLVSAFVEYVFN